MTRHELIPSRLSLRLAQIARELGGELVGDPQFEITGLAPLEAAGETELSFLSNPKYRSQLATSRAGCVIVAPALREEASGRGNDKQGSACIVADDPYLYFARVTQLWQRLRAQQHGDAPRIHPSAVIDPSAEIDPTARIGPLCVVARGAKIGADTVLKSRVTVADDCIVGARCIIHPGAVIGSDGFGFAPRREGADTHWEKIEQLGRVRVGDDVEIGANTCIDRGALAETVIENGVKLDNLIQIAHNVHIGRNTAIAAQVGIAGSTRIGANSTLAGQAGVVGHVQLADGVHVSAATSVTRSLTKPGIYTGMYPFDENDAWQKNAAALRQLATLRERVRMLEKEIKLSNKETEK